MQASPARFNRWILVVAGLLFVGLLGALAYGKQFLSLSSLGLSLNPTSTTKPPASTVRLPESLKPQPQRADAGAAPTTEPAQAPTEGGQASLGGGATTPPPPPGLGQARRQPQPDTSRVPVATLVEDTQAQRTQHVPAQQRQQQGQPQGQEKQKRTPWVIIPTDIGIKRGGGPTKREQEEAANKAAASKLIQPATWARPAKPWLTLFMDQKLAGKLLDNVNSDQPGLFNIETTVPIFDGAGWEWELLPKGSKITVRQEGKPDFGANTLAVKVVQVRLPGPKGIVMLFPGGVGDENGANGMRGKTNNHYDKLILATGINALLSLGSNALAGTPSGYYANPGQQAARETAQSVSKDVKSFTDAQLRVPPTITKKAGEFVTIQLEQNLTFSQNPVVIR